VDKILQRHLPAGCSSTQPIEQQHGQTVDSQSTDFLIAEAEGIRRFVSKLVMFEKAQRQPDDISKP